MDEIITPAEAKLDELLQVLAVLLDRLGGEAVIGYKEFSMYEGVPVLACTLAAGYVRLHLGDEDEEVVFESDSDHLVE
jgi:hypothetical protein